jgi:ATP synthase F1 complex assembly factor 2
MKRKETKKSNTNVTASAADRRIAGRRRFYADVGIVPTSPPPPHHSSFEGVAGSDSVVGEGGRATKFVDSPISAGVDGTNSASGVNNTTMGKMKLSDADRWASMLVPPRRGDEYQKKSSSSWYGVTLDGRTLRTPLGHPLSLPSLSLAIAVGSEWDAQLTHLRPAQMPLMTLCCTAIDQVAANPNAHRNDVLSYLYNDTSCYVADPNNMNDRGLHRRQSRAYSGLHDYCMTNVFGLPRGHDVRPAIAYGEGEALTLCRRPTSDADNGSSGTTSGGGLGRRSGLPHPPLLITRAIRYVDSLDAWTLAALYSSCAESKSFFIGAALIHEAMSGCDGGDGGGAVPAGGGRGDGDDDGEDDDASSRSTKNDVDLPRDGRWASEAARVEEEFNIECWGLVEGGHDYDRLNCSIQMHAASFLARTVASG